MVRSSVSSVFEKPLTKYLAIGLSLANLWLLPFVSILFGAGNDPRAGGFPLDSTYYFSAVLALAIVGVGTALVIVVIETIDPTRRRIGRAIVLIGALFVLFRKWRKYDVIHIPYFADYFSGHVSYTVFILVALVLFTFTAFLFVRYVTLAGRGAELFILMLFPFFVFVVAQLSWRGVRAHARIGWNRSASHTSAGRAPRHVVLLIFDELDRRAFGAYRMPGFKSPEMDRLADESLVADSAAAPARYTEAAIPSILTGKRVDFTKRTSSGDLLLWFHNAQGVLEPIQEPNLFTRLQSHGNNVGVVGWYHSYCHNLARDVSRCWTPAPVPLAPPDIGLLKTTAATLTAGYALDVASKRRAIGREAGLSSRAAIFSTDTLLALTYAHLAVPHTPYLRFFHGSGYFGNLMVVDEALGGIRKEMERAGMWDAATIIVTGDHGTASASIGAPNQGTDTGRSADVPFLVKLPYQHSRVVFTARFGTEVLAELIPSIIAGRINQPRGLAEWLTLHSCASLANRCAQRSSSETR